MIDLVEINWKYLMLAFSQHHHINFNLYFKMLMFMLYQTFFNFGF